MISSIPTDISTNEGIWNPLVLLVALVLILILVYLIRAAGNKRYKKGTGQTRPFLSGNVNDPEGEVRSSDMYWGLLDAFAPIYRLLIRYHTGIVNEYIGAFVTMLAVLLMILLMV